MLTTSIIKSSLWSN